MVNKKIGNEYEGLFVKLMQKKGYWCHIFAYNKNGQPCDVIAVKNNRPHFIDVKHCEENRFDFKNIQPNQITCYEYNEQCGNGNTGFAVWFEKQGKWFWLPYSYLKVLMNNNVKSVHWANLNKIDDIF